jgi:hypothetical protein
MRQGLEGEFPSNPCFDFTSVSPDGSRLQVVQYVCGFTLET